MVENDLPERQTIGLGAPRICERSDESTVPR